MSCRDFNKWWNSLAQCGTKHVRSVRTEVGDYNVPENAAYHIWKEAQKETESLYEDETLRTLRAIAANTLALFVFIMVLSISVVVFGIKYLL